MKKLIVLLAVLLVPVVASADVEDVVFDGDAGIYGDFYATADVIAGETYCDVVAPANFGFISTLCADVIDTFCNHFYDDLGWYIAAVNSYDAEGVCWELDSGYTFDVPVCITVPCDVTIGTTNNFCAMMAYCDPFEVCQPDAGDCENPNDWDGTPIYNTTCCELTVVPTPPGVYILQDTLYFVEVGLTNAYIPFAICNPDPCSLGDEYGYNISSQGLIGSAINVTSTETVVGGKCGDVYGILDAGLAEICDYDTLTIIAWTVEGEAIYDTCVQVVHVVEPLDVPLFSTPVITILVLAMILAAAVIMRRTAANKA